MYLSSILWLLAWPALIITAYCAIWFFMKKIDLLQE
jgi:hypothetical protein